MRKRKINSPQPRLDLLVIHDRLPKSPVQLLDPPLGSVPLGLSLLRSLLFRQLLEQICQLLERRLFVIDGRLESILEGAELLEFGREEGVDASTPTVEEELLRDVVGLDL